jgi:hypothetical protein
VQQANNKESEVAKLDFSKIPKYSQLPIKPGAPAHSNWGVFGDDDEVGCFNFLTPEGIIEAAKLIRDGKAFRLDNRIGYAEPPIGGRATMKHSVKSYEEHGVLAFDDVLDSYNTQEGSNGTGCGTSASLGRKPSITALRRNR